jgi:DNA (cytosine-5)-methyltransferase 1
MLTVGSLFSGLGAFDLAFERAGFRVAWQCEIDKHARAVLAHHWPDVPCYGDISHLDPADLEPVDVVTFGSPCQDLSVAGKRAGMNGARSGLFYEAARVIRGLRPKPALVIWENVAGALSSADGLDFAAVLDCLAECGAMDLCWRVLDGQYAGVAQRRRRVWLVADFGGQRAGSVLLESESLRGHPAQGREAREGAAGDARGSVAAGGVIGMNSQLDSVADGVPVLRAEAGGLGYPVMLPNTTPDDGALLIFDQQNEEAVNAIGSQRADGMNHGCGFSVALRGRDGGATAELGGERATALRASQGGGDKPHVLAFASTGGGGGAIRDIDLSPTIGVGSGREIASPPAIVRPAMMVRRLMPVECLRLMSLPDDWLDGLGLADGVKYRLIGNSLIVNEAHWIATRIRAALEATP